MVLPTSFSILNALTWKAAGGSSRHLGHLKGKHQGSQDLRFHRGCANDIKDGNYCSSPAKSVGSDGSSCTLWIICLRAVSHTCSGVQLCKRSSHRFQGEKRCFSDVTKCTSRLVLLLAGDRYTTRLQPAPCQSREDALDPSPSLPHSPLSYDAAEKRKKKKRKRIWCSTYQTWTKPQLKPRLNRPVLSLLKIGFI